MRKLKGIVVKVLAITALTGVMIYSGCGSSDSTVEIGVAHDYEKDGYIKLGEYKNVKVSVEVTDADIKEEKDYILDDEVYQQVQGTAKSDDMVCISYKGTCDGNLIEDDQVDNTEIQLGDEEVFPEFDKEIVGMNTGDTKTIDVVIPEDSGYDGLEGKTAQYEVKLNYICGELVKPELNDEFVAQYTEGKCTSLSEFDDYIRNELYQNNLNTITEDAWSKVTEGITVEKYHQGELDRAIEDTKKSYENFSDMSGYESKEEFLEDMGMTEDDVEDVAKDAALDKMAAKTIAAKEGLVMDDDAYKELLIKYMEYEEEQAAGMSIEELEADYREAYGDEPRDGMLLEYVKNYVADNADIEGKK